MAAGVLWLAEGHLITKRVRVISSNPFCYGYFVSFFPKILRRIYLPGLSSTSLIKFSKRSGALFRFLSRFTSFNDKPIEPSPLLIMEVITSTFFITCVALSMVALISVLERSSDKLSKFARILLIFALFLWKLFVIGSRFCIILANRAFSDPISPSTSLVIVSMFRNE